MLNKIYLRNLLMSITMATCSGTHALATLTEDEKQLVSNYRRAIQESTDNGLSQTYKKKTDLILSKAPDCEIYASELSLGAFSVLPRDVLVYVLQFFSIDSMAHFQESSLGFSRLMDTYLPDWNRVRKAQIPHQDHISWTQLLRARIAYVESHIASLGVRKTGTDPKETRESFELACRLGDQQALDEKVTALFTGHSHYGYIASPDKAAAFNDELILKGNRRAKERKFMSLAHGRIFSRGRVLYKLDPALATQFMRCLAEQGDEDAIEWVLSKGDVGMPFIANESHGDRMSRRKIYARNYNQKLIDQGNERAIIRAITETRFSGNFFLSSHDFNYYDRDAHLKEFKLYVQGLQRYISEEERPIIDIKVAKRIKWKEKEKTKREIDSTREQKVLNDTAREWRNLNYCIARGDPIAIRYKYNSLVASSIQALQRGIPASENEKFFSARRFIEDLVMQKNLTAISIKIDALLDDGGNVYEINPEEALKLAREWLIAPSL